MTHTIAPPTLEELNERIDVLEANKVEWADFPNHVHVRKLNIELYCLYAVREGVATERALLDFFTWAMNEGPFDGCSLDGCDVQDKAENLGLIVSEKYDPTIHGEHSDREEGDDIYVFAPKIMCDPVLSQSPWMDIETAPKDGSRILIAFANRHVCEAYWHKYWTNPCSGDVIVRTWRNDDDPISWMPLPVPPTQNTQNAKDPHNHGEGDQSVMPDRSGGEQ